MNKKKFVSLLIAILFIFQMSTLAINQSSQDNGRDERIKDVIVSQISRTTNDDVTIASIKKLQDFNGNIYTLAECAPIGYYIFHEESGIFVEYSPESPSPYEGYSEKLYYGGATEYFVLEGSTFKHTILDEEYDISCKEEFSICSIEANKMYMEKKDQRVIDYIENGNEESFTSSASIISSTYITNGNEEFITTPASMITGTYITGSSIFYFMNDEDEFGYLGGGYCGYIAAAMLLFYHDRFTDSAFIDTYDPNGNPYLTLTNNNTTCLNGSTFTYNLYYWHAYTPYQYPNTSDAWKIRDCINHYVPTKGININYQVNLLPSVYTVEGFLDTYDNPYIIFGTLYNPDGGGGFHAVLAYGYTDSHVIVHFGWQDYSNVFVYGPWGSGYGIRGTY